MQPFEVSIIAEPLAARALVTLERAGSFRQAQRAEYEGNEI